MKIDFTLTELSKIESALLDKIDKVDDMMSECVDPDDAKNLLEYSENLHKLHKKVEAKLYGCEIIQTINDI